MIGKHLRTDDKVTPWRCFGALERVMSCEAMLGMHGFLTAEERKRIKRRIETWRKRHAPKERE